ncbi:MAG: hypothetical protein COB39_12730 [Marinosulfonomonas sp.]|nr:MAG: hypothetical protein COB39_12730 [Marinosulfonomonas sp.]
MAGHVPVDPVKPGMKTITGAKAWAVDLKKAAQSVGMPGRENCGNCHFYGGGGDNMKHVICPRPCITRPKRSMCIWRRTV